MAPSEGKEKIIALKAKLRNTKKNGNRCLSKQFPKGKNPKNRGNPYKPTSPDGLANYPRMMK
jgi:hypothetical protein